MHWNIFFALAIPIFFILVFLFFKFTAYKLENDNIEIESLAELVSDNPVGLSEQELEKLKEKQKVAQKQLKEVIDKIPVEMVNGKFVPRPDKLQEELNKAQKNGEALNGKDA